MKIERASATLMKSSMECGVDTEDAKKVKTETGGRPSDVNVKTEDDVKSINPLNPRTRKCHYRLLMVKVRAAC